MRMTNYTAHYQLHQWEPEDSFLRTDFNEDFAKIDGALGGKAEQSAVDTLAEQVAGKSVLVTGSYTGDGEASRTIELGFSPKAVLLASSGDRGTPAPGVPPDAGILSAGRLVGAGLSLPRAATRAAPTGGDVRGQAGISPAL